MDGTMGWIVVDTLYLGSGQDLEAGSLARLGRQEGKGSRPDGFAGQSVRRRSMGTVAEWIQPGASCRQVEV